MPDQANHAIRDGDLPIVYISGDKGLYKLFVDSREIALMKAVAADERAYMAAYGSLTRRTLPVPVAVELLFVPKVPAGSSKTDLRYVFQHYKPDGSITKRAGPAPVTWAGVAVSPFNVDKWLIWTTEWVTELSQPAVYLTTNAGLTWEPVQLSLPGTTTQLSVHKVEWSRHADNFAWITGSARVNAVNVRGAAWYGDPSGTMQRFDLMNNNSTGVLWYYSVVADTGNILGHIRWGGFSKTYKRFILAPTGLAISETAGIPAGLAAASGINIPSSSVILLGNIDPHVNGDKNIWHTANYLTTPPQPTNQAANTQQLAATAEGKVYLGGSATGGVREVLNPFTAPTVAASPVIGAGLPTQAIAADPTTRTVIAVQSMRHADGLYIFVKDGEEWQELSLTELIDDSWISPTNFAVIVRS